jgi:hypothetical protein
MFRNVVTVQDAVVAVTLMESTMQVKKTTRNNHTNLMFGSEYNS